VVNTSQISLRAIVSALPASILMTWRGKLLSPQAIRPQLDPFCIPDLIRAYDRTARVSTVLIEALLISFGSDLANPKMSVLCH
jgi:hypothetical protein